MSLLSNMVITYTLIHVTWSFQVNISISYRIRAAAGQGYTAINDKRNPEYSRVFICLPVAVICKGTLAVQALLEQEPAGKTYRAVSKTRLIDYCVVQCLDILAEIISNDSTAYLEDQELG